MSELQTTATMGHADAPEPIEPTAFGIDAGGWIALAMLVVFALLLRGKFHRTVTETLDSKIDEIRDQLAEAESLRKEAEALKAEYQAKAASADKDREALLERARHEADEIVAKAKTDAQALVERRTRMAEDRSEEHTSELQSHVNLVCRLLLEKKKKTNKTEH